MSKIKHFISGLLSATLTFGIMSTAPFSVNASGTNYGMNLTIDIYVDDEPEELLMGDVDGDGEVKIADVTYIHRALNELFGPFTNGQVIAADVNGDCVVDIKDVTYIQRMLAEF